VLTKRAIVKSFLRMMIVISSVAVVACGPNERGEDDDNGGGGRPDASTPNGFIDASGPTGCTSQGPEVCQGDLDEDCDGLADCHDPDCSGVGSCPVCGSVEHPLSAPLALPDGEGNSYTSALHFQGFGVNQTFANVTDILSVCVKIEHSWLRDLQIELIAPSGQILVLQKFLGQEGGEVFVGTPNDDDDTVPIPGTGADYCWKPDATNAPMLLYANQTGVTVLPPGDYQSSNPFTDLTGAKMNGDWTIKVTDLWAQDNGYIFEWSIAFNPAIFEDCSTPPVQ
jgi:subtilisin-like proprotein convertase family protein